jgi:hypothetical protein
LEGCKHVYELQKVSLKKKYGMVEKETNEEVIELIEDETEEKSNNE